MADDAPDGRWYPDISTPESDSDTCSTSVTSVTASRSESVMSVTMPAMSVLPHGRSFGIEEIVVPSLS